MEVVGGSGGWWRRWVAEVEVAEVEVVGGRVDEWKGDKVGSAG